MVTFLRKIFIKDYTNVKNPKVRDAHGKLACFIGIFSNFILFVMKLVIGLLTGSVAIIGDSINNLSDMGSSVITLLGFKLASMPADKEHPYGHERIEYIAGLIVSLIIIVVGIQLFGSSIQSIMNREIISVSVVTIIILVISILLKLLQGLFYRKIGKTIDSVAIIATSQDSINDVISTSVILIGSILILIFPNMNFPLDGVLGLLVSLFIVISGIKMIKETVDPLIGISPSSSFVKEVVQMIKSHSVVLGVHDIRCHMYGPTKSFMSLHVEVDCSKNILDAHDEIDEIERKVKEEYGIELTIHMDPIEVNNPDVIRLKEIVGKVIKEINHNYSFHDFRLVTGLKERKLLFDVVMPLKERISCEELKKLIAEKMLEYTNEKFIYIIDIDDEYISE